MGVGGPKPSMHEIPETRASGRAALFDAIVARIEEEGGKITKDETTPLYTEIGSQNLEVGAQRVVEFTRNKDEFQIIRNEERELLQGSGHQKHLEKIDVPRVNVILKKKNEHGQWEIVDLEAIAD